MKNNNDLRMVAFSPDLLDKGYKLIYRNGERPEDYKVWPDGSLTTYQNGCLAHSRDGIYFASPDFDLFLTPPEMYVGVAKLVCGNPFTDIFQSLEHLKSAYDTGIYNYFRLVPVE